MLLPTKPDIWYAEAVTRVYAHWLTSGCIGITERRRREVAELIDQARRAACLPPLGPPAARPPAARPYVAGTYVDRPEPRRAPAGRWMRGAA